jgi:hypothetical protein
MPVGCESAGDRRKVGGQARVHASNRSDSKARPTNTRLGLETGAYLSADEALELLNFA